MFEHHGEFAQRFFGDTGLVARLDLLFKVVLHSHRQLIQLVPCLRKTDRRVFSVTIIED